METKFKAYYKHDSGKISSLEHHSTDPDQVFGWKKEGQPLEICQFIGLTDKNDKDFFIGDIGKFDNGDMFFIGCERWLQPFVEFIGDPECEDQARDLYRIEKAVVVGNIHENQELLK